MADKKDIKYLNRDFNSFRAALIDYTKTYFPTTYNDFSPASPGMMIMEMAAYVGDVLSFYLDNQVQETYLQYARQTNNLFELAYMFNYTPKVTGAATTTISVYQLLPSKLSGSTYIPDFDYSLKIGRNSSVTSTLVGVTSFITQDSVDFTVSSSSDPTEVTVYQISSGNPTFFLLKKEVEAISATINTTTFSFGSPQQFPTVTINNDRIIGILDIVDSEGNVWYEVDHLAQDTVYQTIKNTNLNDIIQINDGYKFRGQIADLRLYGKSLTKGIIEQIYYSSQYELQIVGRLTNLLIQQKVRLQLSLLPFNLMSSQ
jgi:hypothetical protein